MHNLQPIIDVWNVELVDDAIIPVSEFPSAVFRFLTDTQSGVFLMADVMSTGLDITIAGWVKMAQAIVDDPEGYVAGDPLNQVELDNLEYPNNITINSIVKWIQEQ